MLVDPTLRNNLLNCIDNNTLNQLLENTHANITQESVITRFRNQATESSKESKNKSVESHHTEKINTVSEEGTVESAHQHISNKIFYDYVHIPDRTAPARAEAVLPTALQLRRDGRVVSRRRLPACTRFGPLRGVNYKVSSAVTLELKIKAADLKAPIFLMKNKDDITHIDVSDKDKSNWLSLLPLGDQSKANVWLYQDDNELYAITALPLAARTILYLGYSKQYIEDHDLPPNQPVLDLTEALLKESRNWWCCECHEAQPSAALLEQHEEICRKQKMSRSRRRRYRCRHCTKTFSRLFTLRRHIMRHCRKKLNKSDLANKSDTTPNVESNVRLSVEDKMPSDESFQNYTNGLDFSTNLFDTDRIPNLESGSSRSEADYPYDIEYKDDNSLSNYLGLSKVTKPKTNTCQNNKTRESFKISCPYCHTEIAKDTKTQHLKQCPALRFECECGTIFYCKKKLAQHVFADHPTKGLKQPTQTETDSNDDSTYKCEECLHVFKRRGMLVNHLWREHREAAAAAAAALPLARRERCFMCGACPKLYRARAKRDAHLRTHHPNAVIDRAQSIIGGKRQYEPAACTACPRQYATRAKLLQHCRARHPQLIPPTTKKKPSKNTKTIIQVC
ncbi:PR domain zinc finger protein 10-like isoform X2 [Galleria mellonella]|nr:PR domain zinc finger protein 10-like isoform X2 [Galleria mellonella]